VREMKLAFITDNHWNTHTKQLTWVQLSAYSLPKALSTLSQKSETVAEKCHCHQKWQNSATVALFSDSRTFLRQIVVLFCDSVDRL